MDKSHFIKLTLAVYRVTGLFPEDEPLRQKIRNKANDILAGLISANPNPAAEKKTLLKDIEILRSYFDLAEAQNWVESLNFLVLCREYDKIEQYLRQPAADPLRLLGLSLEKQIEEPKIENKPKLKPQRENKPAVDNLWGMSCQQANRQKKILEILKEQSKAQVWELKRIFANITKRTLRRDLEYLLKRGLVVRTGVKNNTFYQLNGG